MIFPNSHQPYLYSYLNNKYLLYCYADHESSLLFNTEEYKIKLWKIHLKLLFGSQYKDIILPTITNYQDYGNIVLECNPHIYQNFETGELYLCYTAGFQKHSTSHIEYHLCKVKINDLPVFDIDNSTFEVIKQTFTGTLFNDMIIYVGSDKTNHKSVLMKNNDIIDIKELKYNHIYKITNVFNTENFIITYSAEDDTNHSHILDSHLQPIREITNTAGSPVYKCSLLDNLLVYAGGDGDSERYLKLEYL